MKKFIAIGLILLAGTKSYSQALKTSAEIYNSVPGLTLVKSDSLADKTGIYRKGGSFGGYNFDLDSTGRFVQRSYSCVGGMVLDSGTWYMSKIGRLIFDQCRLFEYLIS